MAVANPFDKMVERPDPARGNDRHPHRIGEAKAHLAASGVPVRL